jgi:hypothetical protein
VVDADRFLRRRRIPAHAVNEDAEEAIRQLVGVGAGGQPRVRPVGRREDEEGGGVVVQIRAKLSALAPLAEECAEALLVAAALGEELVGPLTLEVAPLADEDRGNIELLGDDAQVGAEREPDPRQDWNVVGDLIERGMKRLRALAHGLVEQVLLRVDVRVERALLDAERLREVADRGAVVAALGEEAGGFAG